MLWGATHGSNSQVTVPVTHFHNWTTPNCACTAAFSAQNHTFNAMELIAVFSISCEVTLYVVSGYIICTRYIFAFARRSTLDSKFFTVQC